MPKPAVVSMDRATYTEGILYRSNTFQREIPSDDLPVIDDDDGKSVAELLREYKTEGINDQGFWSYQLLRHIMSRDRILNELKKYQIFDAETYIEHIQPKVDPAEGSETKTYLKVFALLTLLMKGQEIVSFIEENVSDQSLPLRYRPSTARAIIDLGRSDDLGRALECLKKWFLHERESFERTQWELLVPYFDLDENNVARHYLLHDKAILPWCKKDKESSSSSQPSRNEGSFAYVSRIKIDRLSHGFHDICKAVLYEKDLKDEERFQNESAQLRRFNGLLHDHLITLLATFTPRGKYHFIFPYADFALDQYWQTVLPKPSMNIDTIRWFAKQCSGIIAAIDKIHNPEHLPHLKEKGYGRHGDIKPDNILWSNIPNAGIPAVPGYRPPECDIEGGTISRAYDIWTLGCLFLEMLTWLMGGYNYLREFDEKRRTVFILTGGVNNIFFSLKMANESGAYVAQIKTEVKEWFNKLHNDENCTQFIHDALDVIEKEMLVVLCQHKKRSLSGPLRDKFRGFCLKCMDTDDEDYSTKVVPVQRVFRSATAVEATPNESALKAVMDKPTDLETETHVEEMRKALVPEEMGKIDGIQRP